MRRRHVERCGFGNPVDNRSCRDRRLRSGAKRHHSGERRCKTRYVGNLDGAYFAGRHTESRGPKRPKSRVAHRSESHQWSSSFRAELCGLSWFGERSGIAVTDSQRSLPKAPAIGDQWSRGRLRSRFVLEDQTRYSPNWHAFVRLHPQRQRDLDTCAVPKAYGQAAARGTAGLGASAELAGDIRKSDGSEIAYCALPSTRYYELGGAYVALSLARS